jgi:hypothetical protein
LFTCGNQAKEQGRYRMAVRRNEHGRPSMERLEILPHRSPSLFQRNRHYNNSGLKKEKRYVETFGTNHTLRAQACYLRSSSTLATFGRAPSNNLHPIACLFTKIFDLTRRTSTLGTFTFLNHSLSCMMYFSRTPW